ncbi:MAG: hypothetical protein ACKV1O_19935 [Saprospiraceae bacterium]
MKLIPILFALWWMAFASFGQTYTGTSTDKMGKYDCLFRMGKDNAVDFIYNQNEYVVYAAYSGKMERLNDTLYRVSATMTIGQYYMKSWSMDTLYIQLDPAIARQLDKIEVKYADGMIKNFSGYDNKGKAENLLKLPVDKKRFNRSKGADYVTITVNRKDLITGRFLSFKIPFGSAASFTSGQKLEFDLSIKNNIVRTVGEPPLQTGHFKLAKQPSW